MNKRFNCNNKGLTLVEVIMTITILGVVIGPLMNFLVLSEKINKEGENEYKSIQSAQYYMEEIKARDGIDTGVYIYNADDMCYERIIMSPEGYRAEIRIREGNYGLYYIEVDIFKGEDMLNSLKGSTVFN